MLNQVLQEIKTAQGPLTIQELCLRLSVDRSALEAMIHFWVRKGRIQDEAHISGDPKVGSCGTSCGGIHNCSFIAKMPKTYSISPDELGDKQLSKIR